MAADELGFLCHKVVSVSACGINSDDAGYVWNNIMSLLLRLAALVINIYGCQLFSWINVKTLYAYPDLRYMRERRNGN